jgi:hypothetical protein
VRTKNTIQPSANGKGPSRIWFKFRRGAMKKVTTSYFVTAWWSIGLLIDLATNSIWTGSRIGHVDCQPSNSLGFVVSSTTFNMKHGLSSVPAPVRTSCFEFLYRHSATVCISMESTLIRRYQNSTRQVKPTTFGGKPEISFTGAGSFPRFRANRQVHGFVTVRSGWNMVDLWATSGCNDGTWLKQNLKKLL